MLVFSLNKNESNGMNTDQLGINGLVSGLSDGSGPHTVEHSWYKWTGQLLSTTCLVGSNFAWTAHDL